MELAALGALIEGIHAAREGAVDLAEIRRALADIARLRGWLDGCEAELAAATVGRTPVPQREIARSARVSNRAAERMIERHVTASDVPVFGEALANGDVSGAHIDALTATIRALEPVDRHGFRERAAELVQQASASSADDFRSLLRTEARRYSADNGEARLARQRRACRLRSWVDPNDGMWRLSGTFDPESGLRLHGRLASTMARLFHESVPDDAPSDPGERADFLRAHALLRLTADDRPSTRSADRAEIVAVIHVDRPDPERSESPSATPGNTRPASRRTPSNATRGSRPSPASSADRDATAGNPHPAASCSTPFGAPNPATSSVSGGLRSAPRHEGSDSSAGTTLGHRPPDGPAPPAAKPRAGGPTPDLPPLIPSGEPRAGQHSRGPEPHVEWAIPIELPWAVLRDFFELDATADAVVVVCDGVVVHAPGVMNLGRTTRLASRAQRRALRALYPTCAAPGCSVRFDHTQPHHVVWWERGGPTDLDNLLPLCSRHHHLVHEGGWHLALRPDRRLTIRYPDGTTESLDYLPERRSRPPSARAS